MNHPLAKFHRPRRAGGLREAAAARLKAAKRSPALSLDDGAPALPAPRKPSRRPQPPAPIVPLKVPEKHRRRWYQYSLRTLLLLTLVVSLLMSWYAVKLKRAIAQKKAVAEIAKAGGSVMYDYEFNEEHEWVKGSKGHGPPRLRELLGADFFDTIEHVDVNSADGLDGIKRLPRLRTLGLSYSGTFSSTSLAKFRADFEHFEAIDGLEELSVRGPLPDSAFDRIAGCRQLKRLQINYCSLGGAAVPPVLPDVAALRACANLRELSIADCDYSSVAQASIGRLVQLERLDLDPVARFDIRHLRNLGRLRELRITFAGTPDPVFAGSGGSVELAMLEHAEEFRNLSRLEKLSLDGCNLKSSDLKFLCDLPALRELDLSDCTNIDDDAAPFLKKMKGLKVLNLHGTKISDEAAQGVDDALPDCQVKY